MWLVPKNLTCKALGYTNGGLSFVICHLSLVIGHLSFVIGHLSFVNLTVNG
ncbi:MAG: hypothetical protein HEQ19_30065 [Gloeotrichia echinulata CP02]